MSERATTEVSEDAALREVREGLSQPQKRLSAKFFYDTRGSELFEEITRLPEYYLTRTERSLLERWMPEWMGRLRPRSLVELGAGSALKTRIILDAMQAAGRMQRYYPVDVSAEFLQESADALQAEYPDLEVVPVVADISEAFELPQDLAEPAVHAFLGSTIGNFPLSEAVVLLSHIRHAMHPGDRFVMGVDLRKDAAVVEAAYNDAQGVTAEFNLNMLSVLNSRFGADFDPAAFRHRAFYDPRCHCIEMHLVSSVPQTVSIPGAGEFTFVEGESVRTEVSCKHDRESVDHMFRQAGLEVTDWVTDPRGMYALVLASR